MESLYKVQGISRQGFHKHLKKVRAEEHKTDQIIDQVKYHRQTHPRMGARPMHILMQYEERDKALLEGLGRDKFEEILMLNELGVAPIRIFHKTTYSGSFRFSNLTEGVEIQEINRIWVSDLTYYRLLDGWAYLTFILDLYSRRCLGYAFSQTMETEATTIPALEMALDTRAIPDFKDDLIFHSDGGGQYYDKAFLQIIKKYKMKSSMSLSAYENPHMERFHSTAKNDYLIPWGVNSITKLEKQLPRLIHLYNNVRPHQSLKGKTPVAFEEFIKQIPLCQRLPLLFKKIT